MKQDRRISTWETLELGEVDDRGVFGFQEIARRSPRTGRVGTYKVLRIGPWTNVVALTPDDRVVLVEQYRHGIDALTREIPGGVLDPGEDIAVVTVPLTEIPDLIRAGRITHSLVLAGFHWLALRERGLPPDERR